MEALSSNDRKAGVVKTATGFFAEGLTLALGNKKLLAVPLFAFLVQILILLVAFFVYFLVVSGGDEEVFFAKVEVLEVLSTLEILFLFFITALSTYVFVVAQVVILTIADVLLRGERAGGISAGLHIARAKNEVIISWAVVAGVASALLQAISQLGPVASIFSGIGTALFGVIVFFIVPAIFFESLGLFALIKRSARAVLLVWKEAFLAFFLFGVSFIILFGTVVGIGVGLLFLLPEATVVFAIVAVMFSAGAFFVWLLGAVVAIVMKLLLYAKAQGKDHAYIK